MRALLTLLLFTIATATEAQGLAGIWRGKRTQAAHGCFPEYSLELHITYASDQSILGNAYSFTSPQQYTKVQFTGRYNPLTKRLVLIEGSVLSFNVPADCVPCVKTYDLTLTTSGQENALTGEWKGHEMGHRSSACPPGTVTLSRAATPTFPVDVFQSDSLSAIQKNLRLQPREKEVVRTLTVDTPVIKIDLYDNAEIDDDTVSVFLNNTLLLYRKRLTEKPLTLTINAFPDTDYELMLYANNLGRIPPNTSLMIITAGTKKYELRLASSEQKSAVVKLRYGQ